MTASGESRSGCSCLGPECRVGEAEPGDDSTGVKSCHQQIRMPTSSPRNGNRERRKGPRCGGHQLAVPAEVEVDVDPRLEDRGLQIRQASALAFRPAGGPPVLERLAAPVRRAASNRSFVESRSPAARPARPADAATAAAPTSTDSGLMASAYTSPRRTTSCPGEPCGARAPGWSAAERRAPAATRARSPGAGATKVTARSRHRRLARGGHNRTATAVLHLVAPRAQHCRPVLETSMRDGAIRWASHGIYWY